MGKSFPSKTSIKLDNINKINHFKYPGSLPTAYNSLKNIYSWKSAKLWVTTVGTCHILAWTCPHHLSGPGAVEVLGGQGRTQRPPTSLPGRRGLPGFEEGVFLKAMTLQVASKDSQWLHQYEVAVMVHKHISVQGCSHGPTAHTLLVNTDTEHIWVHSAKSKPGQLQKIPELWLCSSPHPPTVPWKHFPLDNLCPITGWLLSYANTGRLLGLKKKTKN